MADPKDNKDDDDNDGTYYIDQNGEKVATNPNENDMMPDSFYKESGYTPPKKKKGGAVSGRLPHKRADKRARGGGIHIKASHKGLLHKDTKTPEGKKISPEKLSKAKNSSDPAVRKRAVFAENAKKWNH